MPGPPVAITSGASWLTKCVIINHDSGAETEVGLVDATVTIDRKSDVRRTVDATITPDVDPALLRAPHRMKLWSGYRIAGVDYWAPLAHVRLSAPSVTPLGAWSLRGCLSFESLVARAKFRQPRNTGSEASMVGLMRQWILEAVPWATVNVVTDRDSITPVGGTTFKEERWQAICGREESMATALSMDVYCDAHGSFTIDEPSPHGWATWWCSERDLLIDYTENPTVDDVVNVVIAHSDHPSTNQVFREVVEDRDPSSPTRIERWGESILFRSSPLITNWDQCARVAHTTLENARGMSVALDMTSVPNPWADVNEYLLSERGGVISGHALDRVVHSLKPTDAMRITTAARTVSISA